LYPAAALVTLARVPWRRTLPWLLAAALLVAIDVMTSLGELQDISAHLTRVGWFSYGSTAMMESYGTLATDASYTYPQVFMIGSAILFAVMGVSVWMRPNLKMEPGWERELYAFRVGAVLFIGTFAMGSNLDYRTVVLIFCLPLLFILRKLPGGGRSWATLALAAIIVYTCWRFLLSDVIFGIFLLKQLVAWTIVFLLTGLLAGTIDGKKDFGLGKDV
jgi:hypothetical protein